MPRFQIASYLRKIQSVSQALTFGFGILSFGLIIGLSFQFVRAWTGPAGVPPSGNLPGPLNTSANAQTKAGQLSITGGGNVAAGSVGGLRIGNQSFSSAAGWLYLGDAANVLYQGQGIAMSNLWVASVNTLGPGAFISDADVAGAYFVDPSLTSNMYIVKRYGGFDDGVAGGEVDVNDPTYKVNPSGDTILKRLCLSSVCNAAWPAGNVTGSGTINRIPLWTGTTALGDSPLSASGTTVTASGNLTVNGLTSANGSLLVSDGGGSWSRIYMVNAGSSGGTKSIYANSNLIGFVNGGGSWLSYWDTNGNMTNAGSISTVNGSIASSSYLVANGGGQPSYLRYTPDGINYYNYLRGDTYFKGRLVDENNSGYFIVPSGTSNMYIVKRYGGYAAGGEVDVDDPRYKVDPSGDTILNRLCLGGTCLSAMPADPTGVYLPLAGGTMNAGATIGFNGGTAYGIGVLGNKNSISVDTVDSGSASDPLELAYYNGAEVRVGQPGGGLSVANKPIYASVFSDGNDWHYYVDPNGGSRLNAIYPNTIWTQSQGQVAQRWDASVYVLEADYWYAHANDGRSMLLGENTNNVIVRGILTPSSLCLSNGCLSAWPAGNVTGSGTINRIPLWTGTTALGDSPLSASGANVTASGTFTANGNVINNQPSQGTLGLTGDLPGYADGLYPTLKTNGTYIYFSTAGAYIGYLWAGGMVASTFTDYNDPRYSVDPNGTSYLNNVHTDGSVLFAGYGHETWFPYVNGWNYLRGPTNLWGVLFDEQNNGYRLDLNDWSNAYIFYRAYGYNGPERDIDNPGYYLDPSSVSNLDTLCIRGTCKTAWPADPTGSYLSLAGGTMNSGAVIDNAGRMHIASTENIYLLARGGTTYVSGAWGGAANLFVDGFTTANNGLKVSNAGGAYSYIYMADDQSPNGVKYIHADSNYIGFLGGASGWLTRWDEAGNMVNTGNINAAGGVTASFLRSTGNVYTDWNYGYGLVGVYDSYRYQGIFAMSDSYKLPADGSGTGNLYGLAWTHSNAGGQSKPGLGHQLLVMTSGTTTAAIGNGFWTNYASSLSYIADTDDPGYYLDPNQTSYLNTLYASAFYYNSDETLKKNIVTIPNALDDILALRGVRFNWKSDDTLSVGVIAQEVEKVYPELVATDEKTGLKSVEYGNLVGPIIEAIKSLNQKVESVLARSDVAEERALEQAATIATQQKAIEQLQSEVELLRSNK